MAIMRSSSSRSVSAKAPADPDPDVEHGDVERAVEVGDEAPEGLDAVVGRGVGLERERVHAVLLPELLGGVVHALALPGDRDVVAALGELGSKLEADSGRAAGDEGEGAGGAHGESPGSGRIVGGCPRRSSGSRYTSPLVASV
jgi:hypothetical protein